ncbi:MAG: hypothetical protein KBS40_00100 [Bacteroidales bacterium]|nr:hypothetical protein [Bacteroidales bacterium]
MQRDLFLQLLESGDIVSIYSPLFKGEQYTEFEKFLIAFMDNEEYGPDLGVIMGRLETIKKMGVQDRFFRFEGRSYDRVHALPAYLESSRLRLYCLCISSKVLILGNGGVKETQTYQEDPYLNKCVETLQKIDFEIRMRENRKEITIKGTQLHGDLSFYIND